MRINKIILIIRYLSSGLMLIIVLSCTAARFDCGESKPYSRGEWYRCGGAYKGVSPSMSMDGKKIVFGSSRYGLGDIIIMNSNSTGWRRLTTTKAYEGDPSFSSDGEKIVFISERDGNGEVYIMHTDGSSQKRLTISDDYNGKPSFSPDGTKIVFVRMVPDQDRNIKRSQIFIMNSDGSNQKRITYGYSSVGPPSFSPDGNKIIFTYRKEGSECIAIMDLDGSNVVDLISNRNNIFSEPSFSSDGSNIVFMSDWHKKDDVDIHLMNIKEGKPKHIMAKNKGDYFIEYPIFISGDTKIMFFAATKERGGKICTINLDGTNLKVISLSY